MSSSTSDAVITNTVTTEDSLGVSDVTEGFTLEDDNEVFVGELNQSLLEEFDEETTRSYDYVGGDADRMVVWSWFPIRWTWVVISELVVGVVGVIGNFFVIIVLFQRRANSRSTDTLIGALAAADLFTSIALLPVRSAKTVPSTWLGQIYCRVIWQALYMWIWAIMSGFLLTAISVERYIAVTHPIYFNRILTRRRVSVVVVILWICAVIATVPSFFVIEVDNVRHRCTVAKSLRSPAIQTAYGVYVTSIQLFIPATIMAITQTLIAIKLKNQSKRFEGSKSYHLAASRAVIKMMLVVIIAYVACWTPNRLLFLLTRLLRIRTEVKSQISEAFFILAAVNSSINPVIYSIRYEEFRKAVKGLFTGQKGQSKAMFETSDKTKSKDKVTA
ncbi:5-hydroxytryptamine receptor 2B-like [Lytechinus variegatus]|uniref:5-hydroxytryptamine receptor 2B-like n=1 Tax=Lytechinus variegatus TaxID=7654 RepID=UPI001BB282DE|nr:5-hydroxytryptamine receptor 2B-like [Lytechinus variegatus]